MNSPDQLRELADRCEKASGPALEVDADAFRAISGPEVNWVGDGDGVFHGKCYTVNYERNPMPRKVPNYTDSIDAAMSLVPVNTRLRGFGEGKSGIWTADIVERDRSLRCLAIGSGATPALALCAAALRARASLASETANG